MRCVSKETKSKARCVVSRYRVQYGETPLRIPPSTPFVRYSLRDQPASETSGDCYSLRLLVRNIEI